jgi:kynurenine 3-monooxygenase
MPGKHISIVGAGLVGSLLAIYLVRRGYKVSVFERRPDMRLKAADAGRSINLALSNRGLKALEEIGAVEKIRQLAIPMHGRMMHAPDNTLTFQPYGADGQYINSIARGSLNILLVEMAEQNGVTFHFNHRVSHVDLVNTTFTCETDGASLHKSFDAIVGADGAFSAIRHAMQFTDRYDFSQSYIEHGYKEFQIPAGKDGQFKMEANALHIWPRESFMLIALPNPDGTFTSTLFFPFEGKPSFGSLNSDVKVRDFFQTYFPDASELMPGLLDDFKTNPTSSLVTIRCYPWVQNKTVLIGDAAHAIVPFYGQGMNAGFEDCSILNSMLDQYHDNWEETILNFQQQRKPDADAIAQLALDNFIEMRDLVADKEFLMRKKIEAKIHSLYPERWIPQYSMVTFQTDIRYSEALRIGAKQKNIMDKVMQLKGIESTWEDLDFEQLVRSLQAT